VASLGTLISTRTPKIKRRLRCKPEHDDGATIFRHACKLGCESIVSKRLGSPYRSGRSRDWLKFKNPVAPVVKREAEQDWGR
jgi:ATP-dependent DNA ligase